MPRTTPFGAFNFQVNLSGSPDPTAPIGGFSDVTGLNTELTTVEYRLGNAVGNHSTKIPLLHKSGDVTLKRGLIDSQALWAWMADARQRGAAAKRTITVTLLDETRSPALQWTLIGAVPLRYNGPALAAKGVSDVALEELVLSVDETNVEFVNPGT